MGEPEYSRRVNITQREYLIRYQASQIHNRALFGHCPHIFHGFPFLINCGTAGKSRRRRIGCPHRRRV